MLRQKCRASAAACTGVAYPLWVANSYSGQCECISTMILSRVTLASTDAAAMQATVESPLVRPGPARISSAGETVGELVPARVQASDRAPHALDVHHIHGN